MNDINTNIDLDLDRLLETPPRVRPAPPDPEVMRKLYDALDAELAHAPVPDLACALAHYDRIRPGISQEARSGSPTWIAKATRAIRFMNATGLRGSRRTWVSMFGSSFNPAGFDHTQIWQKDPSGLRPGYSKSRQYLVTTEPYMASGDMDAAIAWCKARGWAYIERPAWGMWNPPHTTLLLCAPPKNGLDVAAVAQALTEE